MNIDKIFPIETTKRCPLKVGWTTISLCENVISSCHRTGRMTLPEDFNFIHNNNDRKSDRMLMNENKWPTITGSQGGTTNCNYCKAIEESGGISDRMFQINRIKNLGLYDLIPTEVISNPEALDTSITMMEIYFSNLCNMSCIYCKPELSSKWVEENRKFGEHNIKLDILNETYSNRLEKFWKWFPTVYQDLRVLTVLGGEPLIQPELEQMIEFLLNSKPNPKLKFGMFSNLKLSKSRLDKILNKLLILKQSGKVHSVNIKCSIDCWGDSQEYVRYGMKMSEWEENFYHILTKHNWIHVTINSSINSLTIKDMSKLYKNIKEFSKIKPIPVGFSLVTYPRVLDPSVFPNGTFDSDFIEILKEFPYTNNPIEDANTRNHLMGIWERINTVRSVETPRDLKRYLDKLDSRRNTNWKEVFPWLNENYF